MRRKQRLLGIGALSAGLAFGACGEEPTPPAPLVRPIKILELRDPGLAFEVAFPGEVFAVRSADMAFEVSGRLVEFPVIEGQRVDEGQLLARLDSRDFRNGLAAARAERDRARVMRDRVAEAAAAGAVSQQDLSDAQARFGEAQALVNIRRKAFEDASLRAPFAGRIARKLVDNFQNIAAKQKVLTIQDDSSLELKFSVPEAELSDRSQRDELGDANLRLRPAVEVSAFPGRRFPARITELATLADPVTRTFEATLAFENPEDVTLLPGMTARAVLRRRPADVAEGFALPASAVLADVGGASYVWRIGADMTAERALVELGELSGDRVAVRSGLAVGDRIAISGVQQLREGMQVRSLEN